MCCHRLFCRWLSYIRVKEVAVEGDDVEVVIIVIIVIEEANGERDRGGGGRI